MDSQKVVTAPDPNARSIFDERPAEERIYFDFVDRAAAHPEDRPISNGQPAHAAYLIFKFFTNARHKIRIFCGSLRQDLRGVKVYSDPKICEAADKFLSRGGKLEILVEDDLHLDEGQKPEDHPLLAAIARHQASVTVRQVRSHHPIHFLLMDNEAVRIERDKEQAKAIANFHDPKLNELANDIFDEMTMDSMEIAFRNA